MRAQHQFYILPFAYRLRKPQAILRYEVLREGYLFRNLVLGNINFFHMTKVTSPFKSVRKRDGRIVPFDESRIQNAVYRAMQATGEGDLSRDPQRVEDRIVKELVKRFPSTHTPTIEEIQDEAERTLILLDFSKTAKAYILYRSKR